MIWWRPRRPDWLRKPDLMSAAWLAHQERQEQRIEFHGVAIRWPIKKLLNESPAWNKAKQKRCA